MSTMIIVVILSIIVVLAVLGLSVLTVNKGYSYKHTIDPPKKAEQEKLSDRK